MARRDTNRYLGNKAKKEVHDLDNEKTGASQCQIDDHQGWERCVFLTRYSRPGAFAGIRQLPMVPRRITEVACGGTSVSPRIWVSAGEGWMEPGRSPALQPSRIRKPALIVTDPCWHSGQGSSES